MVVTVSFLVCFLLKLFYLDMCLYICFKIMGMDTGSLSTNISISEFIYFSSSKYLIVFYIDDYSVRTV